MCIRDRLTLWLYGSNKLSGSSGYPAIFAPGKAHLIFKGDLYGSLEAQGGYEAPAIGADSAVSSCGTIESVSYTHLDVYKRQAGS